MLPDRLAIADATTPAELAEAAALFRVYAQGLGVDLGFQGFAAELAGLPGRYAPPRGALLLARVGQGPAIGCVALRPLGDAGDAEMKRLYVDPHARGSGLGRRLAEAALDRARAAGYRRVVLDTLPAMAGAQRLYAALGFREIAPYYANPIPGARFLARDFLEIT
jgi:ribosomal protein S18 acetylase RimI-like enzyme